MGVLTGQGLEASNLESRLKASARFVLASSASYQAVNGDVKEHVGVLRMILAAKHPTPEHRTVLITEL
jgi:hypothetical protein